MIFTQGYLHSIKASFHARPSKMTVILVLDKKVHAFFMTYIYQILSLVISSFGLFSWKLPIYKLLSSYRTQTVYVIYVFVARYHLPQHNTVILNIKEILNQPCPIIEDEF